MNISEQTKELVCETLKALVEEWGPDLIRVKVPDAWRQCGIMSLGQVQLEFCNTDRLSICVDGDDGTPMLARTFQLIV